MSAARAIILVLLFIASGAVASEQGPSSAEVAAAARGIAGSLEVTLPGSRLRARPNQSAASPLLVRITGATPAPGGATAYRMEFLGVLAGTHDLREVLEHEDGSPAADLPPLPVRIYTQLPPDHGTDIYGLAEQPFTLVGWYRRSLVILGVVWVAVPVIVLVRRYLRRPAPAPPAPVIPPRSLADELRPLLEAARARIMTVAERGRLELLLYQFWRERLALPESDQARAIAQLRAHPEAGRLLLAVEGWLHQRDRGTETPDSDVSELLEPFRGVVYSAAAGHAEATA